MQRETNNELIAAIAAAALIAFGVVFGVLLAQTSGEADPEDTRTVSPETQVAGSTAGEAESNVGDVAMATTSVTTGTISPTDQAGTQSTSVDAVTREGRLVTEMPVDEVLSATMITTTLPEEESSTAVPPVTEKVTQSVTRQTPPSVAQSGTEAATSVLGTPVAPDTATRTARPTVTATATTTSTKTTTATASATATATSTMTQTATPTSTLRPSRTPTPTQSSTHTSVPRATRTAVPTDLGIVATPTNDGSATPEVCQAPQDWVDYVVQSGDTLFTLALSVNATVDDLQRANCLDDINRITTGDPLVLPRLPRPRTAQQPPANDTVVEGCSSPAFRITSPAPGQVVTGMMDIRGTAAFEGFDYYKLEIRAEDARIFSFLLRSDTPVIDGALGAVDTSPFASGVYILRLVVVDESGNIPPDATCAVPVVID